MTIQPQDERENRREKRKKGGKALITPARNIL